MRAAGITLLSLALTTAVIGNAYYQKKQFYPSVVYITKSNPSMAVIYIQALVLVILMGKLMQKVFFGQLRAAEFEHLADRSWYAVTETCLAFTVFRDDFSPKFVALFTVLFFLKSFHWLAEDRVDFMERSPFISWLFHVRVVSLVFILTILDAYFVAHAYHSTVSKGASVQLVFGFEYMILLMIVFNITIKYALHTIDLQSENAWDNKAVFLLYTEVVMGMLKVMLYVTFVIIMVRIYTLPLFAFRPMYYTMRSFKKAINDVILSRRAIRNMNTLYPDATPAELSAADNVCIICREEMVSASKKLPCNHIFHTSCLRSWFQRQQTCPTCRLNILRIPGETNAAANPPAGPAGAAQPPLVPDAPPAPHQGMPHPFANGVFPAMFPLWQQHFHMHPQNQQPQQPQPQPQPQSGQGSPTQSSQPASGSPPSSSSDSSNASQLPGTGAMPPLPPLPPGFGLPLFCPPFPPVPPFAMPPPMPPPGLLNMSDDELRRLESASREGVAARLMCLQNIQQLLDAAVLMMQQYSSAAASASASAAAATASAAAAAAAAPPATSGSTPPSTPATSPSTENPTVSRRPDVTEESSPSTSRQGSSSHVAPDSTVSGSSISPSTSLSSEHDEVRRRRLQKFAGQAEPVD